MTGGRPVPARLPLEAVSARVWQELARAPHDRHHGWRTPTLATLGLDGTPQARTVVLREVDAARRALVVFTDARSPKCAESRAMPAAQIVFWSTRLQWQLRVTATASVLTEGELVRAAWARVGTSPAAADYLAPRAPGTPLADTAPPDAARTGEGHHLAILRFAVTGIDWLELHREGHRRARIMPDGRVLALQA